MSIHQPGPPLRSAVKGSRQLIPPEFLAKTGFETINQQSPLDVDINEPGWVDLLIESQVEQTRTNEHRKSNTYLLGTIKKELDDETFIARTGQIGHHKRQLVREGSELEVDTLTETADQRNLGNGWMDQNLTSVDEVWPDLVSSIEIPDVLPDIFKALLPVYVRDHTESGIIDDPPILPLGDFERTESQLTEFHKRIHTRGRAGITLPQSVVVLRHWGGMKYGGAVTEIDGFLDDIESPVELGVEVVNSEVKNLGNGTWFRQTERLDEGYNLEWSTLIERLFDPEMQTHFMREIQTVDTSYIPDTGPGFTEDVRAIDFQHSQRIKTIKTPTAVDEASALVKSIFAPYQFPGTVDTIVAFNSNNIIGYRQTRAELVEQIVKTWWVNSATKPSVAFDEIITDSIVIGGIGGSAQNYHGVLHDDWTTTVIVGGFPVFYTTTQFYPATTPSFETYYKGTPDATFTDRNVPALYAPGSGYILGETLSFSGDGGSATVEITATGVGGSILAWTTTSASGWTPASAAWGPYTASGGSGSGAEFNVIAYAEPNYIPGTAWVGSLKVVSADVTQTEIDGQWKIETRSIVMR